MVFLVGTAAYIGPAPHLDVVSWQMFLQQPITIQYSPSMIDFSAQGWSKGCRSKESHLQAPSVHAAAARNLVESPEMT